MPVQMVKNSRIANPIVLDVIPLTVEMARAVLLPSELPEDIPIPNPFSPPFAGNVCLMIIKTNRQVSFFQI